MHLYLWAPRVWLCVVLELVAFVPDGVEVVGDGRRAPRLDAADRDDLPAGVVQLAPGHIVLFGELIVCAQLAAAVGLDNRHVVIVHDRSFHDQPLREHPVHALAASYVKVARCYARRD